MELPYDVGTGTVMQSVMKSGMVISDWNMQYDSDIYVGGVNSGAFVQLLFCFKQGVLWEREGMGECISMEQGKCMPDSSIMLALCNILDITVNELLSGERIEMNNYEDKVSENLIELKRKDENNMNKNTLISIIYTIAIVVGILVCCICDVASSGTLTWSLITLSSILVTWITSFPIILFGKKGISVAMIAISIFILPFMYILSILVKVKEVFSIGAIMSIITLVYLWIIYFLYYRLKERKLLAAGITFLTAIPFTLLINIILSKKMGEPVIDVWDILSVFILLIIAVAFIIGDYARRKGYVR